MSTATNLIVGLEFLCKWYGKDRVTVHATQGMLFAFVYRAENTIAGIQVLPGLGWIYDARRGCWGIKADGS